MKIVSWNVNGLRAVLKKDFCGYLELEQPDILCLQEIKARPEQVDWTPPADYDVWWNSAEKPGYSGTLTMSRVAPLAVTTGIGNVIGDAEGRVQTLEFEKFFLVNVYTPNAKGDLSRLSYRTEEWDLAFREHCIRLGEQKSVIFCGDLNVAHEEIDLANPRTNRRNAGFTDEERGAFREHLEAGFIDSFRSLYPDKEGAYSWWSYRMGARSRNVGWRIDYVCTSASLEGRLKDSFIRAEILGSDHCPVGIEIEI